MSVAIGQTDLRYNINRRAMASLARKVLSGESAADRSVNILYCRDDEIRNLNARFKGRRRTTDVLSFDLWDQDDPGFLGEIYVNLQQARRQARDHGVSYVEEVKRLTVHGILHLLGYDDCTEIDRARMWARQEGYLSDGDKRR